MPVEQMSLAEYDRVAETNTRGVWLTSMAFGALLRAPCGAGRAGTIINVDSFVTHSPLKHVVAYAMSKAGLTFELVDSPMRSGYGADKVKLFWVRAPAQGEGAGKEAAAVSAKG